MLPSIFYRIVLPLLTVEETCFLCISTRPEERDNYFAKLMKSGLIRTMEISSVCGPCKAAGRTKAKACKHMQDDVPNWSSAARRALITKMYGQENQELNERENMGLDTEDGPECFCEGSVEAFVSQPPIKLGLAARHPYVYTFLDPAGGNKNAAKPTSHLALMSVLGAPGCTIVGMEAINVSGMRQEYEAIIATYFERLLRVPALDSAVHVVAVEGNYGGVLLGAILNTISRVLRGRLVLMQDASATTKETVTTDEKNKAKAVDMASETLDGRQAFFSDALVTSHPDPAKMVAELRRQLLAFQRVTDPARDAWHLGRTGFTGKKGGLPDDLAMAFMMVLFWRLRFWVDDRYKAFHRQLGAPTM